MTPPVIAFHSATGSKTWRGQIDAPAKMLIERDPAKAIDSLHKLEQQSLETRCAGYLNYDLGRVFEALPQRAADDLSLPLVQFAIENNSGLPPREGGIKGGVLSVGEQLEAQHPSPYPASRDCPQGEGENPFTSTFTRSGYESAVQTCLDYIAAGDVFQINLSQRLRIPITESAWTIYQRLQQQFPADFGAFLDLGDHQILSNSPELFLRVTRLPDGRRKIVNRPIKGTRPNAPGMADALRDSAKDKAELAMIVDLQRNDLGRICEIGSVVVTESRTIETHPTVLHGVATVEGILREDISLVDILRATFPCGSITGCPKIRAMEIIEELEPVRRGAYCGAIGWIANGEMEFSVAIRTITIQNHIAHVPVGGGIVADSNPADEYEETLVKARAMLSALGVVPNR